jgi:hypothetical protein
MPVSFPGHEDELSRMRGNSSTPFWYPLVLKNLSASNASTITSSCGSSLYVEAMCLPVRLRFLSTPIVLTFARADSHHLDASSQAGEVPATKSLFAPMTLAHWLRPGGVGRWTRLPIRLSAREMCTGVGSIGRSVGR